MKVRIAAPRVALLFSFLFVLAFATACPKPPAPDALITGTPLPLDDPRSLDVMAAHEARASMGAALRGSARVSISRPDFDLKRPQRIAIARPDRLRFEVLGLFDVLAAVLATDGETFGFFDASTGDVTRGFVTADLLWDVTGLDLSTDEVAGLLLAAPTPSMDLVLSAAWVEADEGITVAYGPGVAGPTPTLRDLEAGGEFFRFDAQGLLREVRALDSGWVTRYRASFDAYEDTDASDSRNGGSRPYPKRITIRSPSVEAIALFEWKRVMLTDELPDRIFMIPARVGE